MQEAFNRVVKLSGKRNGSKSGKTGRMASASNAGTILSTTLNNNIMTEKYQTIARLAGAAGGKFEKVDADGVYMNASLLDTLQANIEAAQKEKADALALVETLTAEKNELTAKVEELTAQAETKETEHAKAIEDLNAAHATALEEKDNQISALEQEKADLQGEVNAKAESIEAMQTELNGAKESLTTAENTIAERDATLAERDQQITDLNAQIAELQNDPGTGAQAGAAPQNNGGGAEAPQVAIGTQYAYDNSLSYEENMKRKKEWEAEHK
jgi:DNA repair exonuclease SbcCD ATPase subunit